MDSAVSAYFTRCHLHCILCAAAAPRRYTRGTGTWCLMVRPSQPGAQFCLLHRPLFLRENNQGVGHAALQAHPNRTISHCQDTLQLTPHAIPPPLAVGACSYLAPLTIRVCNVAVPALALVTASFGTPTSPVPGPKNVELGRYKTVCALLVPCSWRFSSRYPKKSIPQKWLFCPTRSIGTPREDG